MLVKVKQLYKEGKLDDRDRSIIGYYLSKIESSKCSRCIYYRDD